MEQQSLQPGIVLKNRYRIDGVLGEGAHGTVYSAADLNIDGTSWAVKEIRECSLPAGERQDVLAHFYREAGILRSLNHTGVPKVVDVFCHDSCHYMVMEHVEGQTLQELFRSAKPDVRTVVGWALRLCQILECLHESNPHPLIFRDLKPANIMITGRGRLILIDFGIARFLNPAKNGDTVALGTPGYAPPEQYGNAKTDCRSDIYSLGATMYELLTGADPASYNFCFPPLAELNPSVGPRLEGIVMRCLERLPEKRFQSVRELHVELKALYSRKQTYTAGASAGLQPLSTGTGAGGSGSTPTPLVPLPSYARLWNPNVQRPPLGAGFMPKRVLQFVENMSEPAIAISKNLMIPFFITALLASMPGEAGCALGLTISMIWVGGFIFAFIMLPGIFLRRPWLGFIVLLIIASTFADFPCVYIARSWLSPILSSLTLLIAILLFPLLTLNRNYFFAFWTLFLATMEYGLLYLGLLNLHM